jgi:hypothetical protein
MGVMPQLLSIDAKFELNVPTKGADAMLVVMPKYFIFPEKF